MVENIGEDGPYKNVSKYIHDLIQQDGNRTEKQHFERLKAELSLAFAAPESTYVAVTALDIIQRKPIL